MMTVGELTAAHLGATLSITVQVTLDGGTETYTGPLVRVQHDATDPERPTTLVSIGAWSGPLDPTHPLQQEDETDG